MTKRFETAFNALTAAFFDGTLAKGTCTACAVGNIVAGGMGAKIVKYEDDILGIEFDCTMENTFWFKLFHTSCQRQHLGVTLYGSPVPVSEILFLSDKLLDITGYESYELAKVEYAFEVNTNIHFDGYENCDEQEILQDQYSGLMAVMNVLIELDQVQDGEIYKTAFKKHPKLQTV